MENIRLSHVFKWQSENELLLGMMKAFDNRRDAKRARENGARRRAEDPAYRIECNMRGRLYAALKGKGKSKRTMELVGCTAVALKDYLQSLFTEGMTWQNHGEWEVDHKCPVALFDLSDPWEQRICFHFTNLQPLWKHDNREKSDRYTAMDALARWGV
jgi:hypothetical protein